MKITVNKTESFFKGMCLMSAFSLSQCSTGGAARIAV